MGLFCFTGMDLKLWTKKGFSYSIFDDTNL